MIIIDLVLILVICLLIKEDIENKGSFAESSTGIFLQDVGLYNETLRCCEWSKDVFVKSKELIKTGFPSYYDMTGEFMETIGSTLATYTNSTLVVTKKWAYIITHKRANEYFPIVKENIVIFANDTKRGIDELGKYLVLLIKMFLEWSTQYTEIVWEHIESIVLCTKSFIEDTLSVNIDIPHLRNEAKHAVDTLLQYKNDLWDYIIDKLNLERTI